MDGLILVHKPKGVTSHDIVIRIRKNLKLKKVGHFGTLDPLASGLLLIAVGKATRLFPFYLHSAKSYEGQIRLGYSTDTYDSEGKPSSVESKNYPDKTGLLENMKYFLGKIDQLPPPYSAKKYKGEALYKRVRAQKEYELKSSKVNVYLFELKKYSPPYFDFHVKCSSGTYIRSIAHDLGQSLGCGAHLNRLKRTEIGSFYVDRSHTVEEIEEMASARQVDEFLHPMEVLLPEIPKIVVSDSDALLVRNGRIFSHHLERSLEKDTNMGEEQKEDILRIFNSQGKLLALAKKDTQKDSIHPFLVLI
jgi:tRNA pseudouridine55 synthase